MAVARCSILVARDIHDAEYGPHRQRFLAYQGFFLYAMSSATPTDLLGPAFRATGWAADRAGCAYLCQADRGLPGTLRSPASPRSLTSSSYLCARPTHRRLPFGDQPAIVV